MMTPFANSWRSIKVPTEGRKRAVCLFASLAFSAPAWAQDASTLFRQMQNAEKTVSYQARQVLTRQGEPPQIANIWREGQKRRVEWLAPDVRQGDVLVDDGNNVWLYHRSENAVTQTKSRLRTPGPRTATGKWSVKRAGGAIVLRNGQQAFTLDGRTKALLQVQRETSAWAIKDVRFGAVDDSQFRFRTPSGATITRLKGTLYNSLPAAQRAASWLKVPTDLPKAYRFESAVIGQGQAWLRYSNGARRFSLFQGLAKGESNTDIQKVKEAKNSWFWKNNGNRFLATGLPKDAANDIAKSLK